MCQCMSTMLYYVYGYVNVCREREREFDLNHSQMGSEFLSELKTQEMA
jgi:hypothetical protein